MSEPNKGDSKNYSRAALFILFFAAIVFLIVRNAAVVSNILKVAIGFGGVVLIHEFGHFLFAKLSDIEVEAFSILMPPTLIGVKRTEQGFRIRILPGLFKKEEEAKPEDAKPEDAEQGETPMTFTVGPKGKAGETEYRIGLIPFGGFVKMLGQDDVGSVKANKNPRSFANKPIPARVAVISAGVVFNIISAVFIFMAIFLIGIKLPPAVVGGVIPDSPAARAGIRPGDEIIEIAGKSDDLDFGNIMIEAALSGRGEEVSMTVRHEDGSEEDFKIAAEDFEGADLRIFGMLRPMSLTIAPVKDPDALFEKTGLRPGDRVTTVNGTPVKAYWELEEMVRNSLQPAVTILAERIDPAAKQIQQVESQIQLDFPPAAKINVKSESDLYHIYSMTPRLRIDAVSSALAGQNKWKSLLRKIGIKKEQLAEQCPLQKDDIILAVGDVENPTFADLRSITEEYEDKQLNVKVLRTDANGVESDVAVTVVPRRPPGGERAMIGIIPVLDVEHAVVAKTIQTADGPEKLEIPRGAVITAVGGQAVSDFYDCIREISKYPGQQVTIDYLDKQNAGAVALNVGRVAECVTVKPVPAQSIPFDELRRLYKATGPNIISRLGKSVAMGYDKTLAFIAQTYVTLRQLVTGLVSPKNLMGPVGILTVSYTIVAEQPFINYVYLLGLISVCLAVFNFLPLPPLDGGLIVIMVVEKIKGSALSERTQGAIAYVGWVLIGGLFLYVTFNDIVRSFFS